jgi:ABC-type uncharacterized transport system involved in gliding motility auxiliary subunit
MRRSATTLAAAGIGLAAVLFVSANRLTGRMFGDSGLDLTDQGLYTLAPGTRAILRRIDEPISLKLYYLERLGELAPSYGVYAARVRQLLREYAALSHGKIKLQIVDPLPYSESEDQATEAGLQSAPVGESGEVVYFGLAGSNSTDDTETIPFFQRDRESFLEYDLTKLVQSLAFPKKKVVGLISALALDGDPMAEMRRQPTQPQAVLEQLRQNYEVRDLSTSVNAIPADVDVLMIVQPQKLAPKTEYAIDQFVLGGGHALVFADPLSEFQTAHRSPMQAPGGATAADFDRMLHAWGVDLVHGKLVGDRLAATQVSMGSGDHPEAVDYVLWLSLRGNDINTADPITGKLTEINLATAGALQPVPGARTGFEPLLQSSDDAELVDASRAAGPVPDAVGLLQDFKPAGKRFTLAARVTGVVGTAFPDGSPKDPAAKPGDKAASDAAQRAAAAQIKTAKAPINVVVVADSDLLDDRFWMQYQDFIGRRVGQPFAANGDFVQNAVDSLAGTNDLINLRSRGSAVRPFTLVDRMRRLADDRYRAQENDLQGRLKDTQAKLASIKPPDDASDSVQLTPDQAKAVDQFRSQIVQTRGELRHVQAALRENIDRLKNRLVLSNVVLVPACVAAAAMIMGLLRIRRRRRRAPAN